MRVHPVNVVAVNPVYVTISWALKVWPITSTLSIDPIPKEPVVGNPVVESTVIVVAVLVIAPFYNVYTVLLPVG